MKWAFTSWIYDGSNRRTKTPLERKEKEISELEGQMLPFRREHWDSAKDSPVWTCKCKKAVKLPTQTVSVGRPTGARLAAPDVVQPATF